MRRSRAAIAGVAMALVMGGLGACSALSGLDDFSVGDGAPDAGADGLPEIPCASRDDCPEDSACATFTCGDARCVPSFAPSGTEIAGSERGDCHKEVCSPSGDVTTEVDDLDAPDDGNECTDDTCFEGAPSYDPAPTGTPCGKDGVLQCNVLGECAGCASAGQCVSQNPCLFATCVDMTCSTTKAPYGTPVGVDAPADCKNSQCNGLGNVEVVADDAEQPPSDMNPCTIDNCAGGLAIYVAAQDATPCEPGAAGAPGGPQGACCKGECITTECNSGD